MTDSNRYTPMQRILWLVLLCVALAACAFTAITLGWKE